MRPQPTWMLSGEPVLLICLAVTQRLRVCVCACVDR
jgi:hypothetical protein